MPQASEDLVRRVWLRYKRTGAKVLRDYLITWYLPVVEGHAERLCAKLPPSVQRDDMISAGVLGLLDAMDVYDPGRPVKFETFAALRIRGAMCDELRSLDMLSRLLRRRARELTGTSDQLEAELGRRPTDAEVARRLDLPIERYQRYARCARAPLVHSLSGDHSGDRRQAQTAWDLPDPRCGDPAGNVQKHMLRDLVTRGLSRPQRLIVLLYYYEGLPMRQIGRALDLSESRVSQMHKDIIRHLRQQVASRHHEFDEYAAA